MSSIKSLGGRRALHFALLSAAFVSLASCEGGEGNVSDEDIQRAQAVLRPFEQELQEALREGLCGGPESAIAVCQSRAPEIAAALGSDGVAMGRTSHRLRNPKNAPERWMEPLLADFLEKPADRTYRAVRLPDGSIGYVEPIYIQPLCLTCHGAHIPPTIAERLDSLYPQDNGRGFEPGEFRGMFWAKLSTTGKSP